MRFPMANHRLIPIPGVIPMRPRCTSALLLALTVPLLPGPLLAQTTRPATQPGTQEATATDTAAAKAYVQAIEKTHGGALWAQRRALTMRASISFGGNERFVGQMTYAPHRNQVRMEADNGDLLVFDGQKAWVSPRTANYPPGARFHLLTWTYFLAAPFKLDDPGTHVRLTGEHPLRGRHHPTAKLTFGQGVGDSPEDWYVLYRDPVTHRLAAMSYIVTYTKSAEKAEEEPHAVTYHAFDDVDGVKLPLLWKFWLWSAERGVYGDRLGEVILSDVRFVPYRAGAFSKPGDAREDKLPDEGKEQE
jgi:hypothetical protein